MTDKLVVEIRPIAMADAPQTAAVKAMTRPVDVAVEMRKFESGMASAYDYAPMRNPFSEVVPHPEEAYASSRDSDRFMGWCMAVQASPIAFQARVQPWMLECFGREIAADRRERNHRFFEEAAELVQACGMTASEAHQLVDYTWSRPIGEKVQEAGGAMVTLAALCLANGLDMHAAGETELARISDPETMAKIRAKQAAKPKHSPLPEARAAAPQAQGVAVGHVLVPIALLNECRDVARETPTAYYLDLGQRIEAALTAPSREQVGAANWVTKANADINAGYAQIGEAFMELCSELGCPNNTNMLDWARGRMTCDTCHGTGRMFVGNSGRESDGNAPEFERCPSCAYGEDREQVGEIEADARRMRTLCRLLDAMDDIGNGFPGEVHAAFQDGAKRTREALDAQRAPEDDVSPSRECGERSEVSPIVAPYPNCSFRICDLPGQCRSEGKCHHPVKATLTGELWRASVEKELRELAEFAGSRLSGPYQSGFLQCVEEIATRLHLADEIQNFSTQDTPTPSGQCVHPKGIIGDDGGTPCCPVTMTPDATPCAPIAGTEYPVKQVGVPHPSDKPIVVTLSAPTDEQILTDAEEAFGRSREYSNCFSEPSERSLLHFVRKYMGAPTAPAQELEEDPLFVSARDAYKREFEDSKNEATAPAQGEPEAWAVLNGVCLVSLSQHKDAAERYAAELQKRHDLSGSLAAFHVEPLVVQHPAPAVAKEGMTEEQQRDAIDKAIYEHIPPKVALVNAAALYAMGRALLGAKGE